MESVSLPPPPQSPHWKQAPQGVSMLSERRVGDSLPPLSRSDYVAKDSHDLPSSESGRLVSSVTKHSISALASPSSNYPCPPPPYSYHSSAPSHAAGPNGYISPPDSQRTSVDDKDQGRHSLPSIHEALGKDPSILYRATPPNVQVPPPTAATASHNNISPTNVAPRSHPEAGVSGPPNPYAATQGLSPYSHEAREGKMQPPYRQGSHGEEHARRNGSDSGPSSGHPISPIQPSGQSPHSALPTQSPSTYAPPGQPVQAPPYRPYQPAYSYPPPAPSSFAAVNNYSPSHQWRGDGSEADDPRKATVKPGTGAPQHYGESVKRHLDIYDLETSLNEMAEGCGRGLEFARHYGSRAHQTQRSGPTLNSLPKLQECDDMLKRQERVLMSISRIRDVVIAQQTAAAEQRSRDEVKAKQEYPEDANVGSDKSDRGGGFAGSDPKKRRGRNAPPGRCHSCNRAETPEWRRGPDGARTLCNACGLHYAKITRKHGQKAGMTSSNLRPKDGEGQ